MQNFRYIDNITTLKLDTDQCIGCGQCATVCPHRVFIIEHHKAKIIDANGCMECGACVQNCPTQAVEVRPGVGCAALIVGQWLNKLLGTKSPTGCC